MAFVGIINIIIIKWRIPAFAKNSGSNSNCYIFSERKCFLIVLSNCAICLLHLPFRQTSFLSSPCSGDSSSSWPAGTSFIFLGFLQKQLFTTRFVKIGVKTYFPNCSPSAIDSGNCLFSVSGNNKDKQPPISAKAPKIINGKGVQYSL